MDEEFDLGWGDDAPKNELERVSPCDFDEDPKGHQEEDLDSCAREFDEKKTRTKPSIAIRCVFIGIPSVLDIGKYGGIVAKIFGKVEIYFDFAGGVSI